MFLKTRLTNERYVDAGNFPATYSLFGSKLARVEQRKSNVARQTHFTRETLPRAVSLLTVGTGDKSERKNDVVFRSSLSSTLFRRSCASAPSHAFTLIVRITRKQSRTNESQSHKGIIRARSLEIPLFSRVISCSMSTLSYVLHSYNCTPLCVELYTCVCAYSVIHMCSHSRLGNILACK